MKAARGGSSHHLGGRSGGGGALAAPCRRRERTPQGGAAGELSLSLSQCGRRRVAPACKVWGQWMQRCESRDVEMRRDSRRRQGCPWAISRRQYSLGSRRLGLLLCCAPDAASYRTPSSTLQSVTISLRTRYCTRYCTYHSADYSALIVQFLRTGRLTVRPGLRSHASTYTLTPAPPRTLAGYPGTPVCNVHTRPRSFVRPPFYTAEAPQATKSDSRCDCR